MDRVVGWEAVPARYADNRHILSWWTRRHDDAIRAQMQRMGWYYGWYIHDAVQAVTPAEVLQRWRQDDPLCEQYAFYNIIMYFGIARAQTSGMEREIAPPRFLACAACGLQFNERDHPQHLMKWVGGRANLRCCPACTELICLAGGAGGTSGRVSADDPRPDDHAGEQTITAFLTRLATILECIPTQKWVDHIDWAGVADEQLQQLTQLCTRYPTQDAVKRRFGSWLGGLVASGVLADGTHKGVFGTRTLARDGHVCNSLAEKTIDDWLSANGIAHTKEPRYPDSAMRADFAVNGMLVEYFGLVGNADYDEKIQVKRELAKRHGTRLIEIYPKDLASWASFQKRLARALGVSVG